MNSMKTINQAIKQCAALVLLFLSLSTGLHATSVLQVDMGQLLDNAAVIFEGEVIASEAKWNTEKTYVSTWITFRVDDVLKGDLTSATIIQSFAGGTVGDATLAVSGMVYPQIGETGIYFIENPNRQQVNPIVGWSQGHFKVKKDKQGKERMLTESDAPIQGLDDVSPSNIKGKREQNEADSPLSEGTAQGLRAGASQDALETAINKEDFKNALRTRLLLMKVANEAQGEAGKPE